MPKKSARKPTRTRAQRMSPAQRREQILDSAVSSIVEHGLSSCTLENVAAHASISKPLIYKYFPRRDDLLKALVEREYGYLRGRGLNVVSRDIPFEELIARANLRAVEYLYERGPIMRLLAGDRAVSRLVKRQDRDERGDITDYFVKRLMREYALPKDVATICSVMTVNAPILSAPLLKRLGIPAKRTAEVWSAFTNAGNKALLALYGTPKRRTSRTVKRVASTNNR